MPNVLLVEDEINITSFIKRGLEENGYLTETANDGLIGLEMALSGRYDVLILDIILPSMNGLDICRTIRQKMGFNINIIMLTALGTTSDIVMGLDCGADDYLSKPFRFQELFARIKSVARRGGMSNNNKLCFWGLEIDTDSKEVYRDGNRIELTALEFRLLEFFVKNRGKVLTRSQILQNVWGIDFDTNTNIVDVYVNYLRNKIDKGFDNKLIHTMIGAGYILKSIEK